MPRRNRIPIEHRERIVCAFEDEAENYFLVQTRLNLDPDEEVIFIYDGAPAHQNPGIPGANAELEMFPAYSPFLSIVEQAISSLKEAMKGDVSMRTRLLLDTLQRCIGVITAAKAYQWFRFMQTYLPRCLNGNEIEG